jgi:hypothetical protein
LRDATERLFLVGPESMLFSIQATIGATQPRKTYPQLPIEVADTFPSGPQAVAEEPGFPEVDHGESARFGQTGKAEG